VKKYPCARADESIAGSCFSVLNEDRASWAPCVGTIADAAALVTASRLVSRCKFHIA